MNPEALKKYKLWSVHTTGLLADCGGGEDRQRGPEPGNERVKNLVKDAHYVMSPFLRPNADKRAYVDELVEIIQKAWVMDRDLYGQAAHVRWFFGNKTPMLFNEEIMALERGEKAPAARREVALVIAPALYKWGKSNGDDLDGPAQLLLASEVTCKPVHDGQMWTDISPYTGWVHDGHMWKPTNLI